MSLPRFFIMGTGPCQEGTVIPLDLDQTRHLQVLRSQPGDALEIVSPDGAWSADLVELDRSRAAARLTGALPDTCEVSVPIQAWIPITAQLSLVDDMLPPLVELGVSAIQPVVFARSQYDAKKTVARSDRWRRIVLSACEQSHRMRIPELRDPAPFEALLTVDVSQKWVAYENRTGQKNPDWTQGSIAFTSGPEGGITNEEFCALMGNGWNPVRLGSAILRAVTAPVAMLGAIQFRMGK